MYRGLARVLRSPSNPQNCRKKGKILEKGTFIFCAKLWYAPNLVQKRSDFKNLLTPLFLMGCFPVDFQEVKRPLRTKSGKRPIKVGKRPIKEAKRPIKAMVLVGISVGCLMGCFWAPKPCRKTAPLKRPIKRSMRIVEFISDSWHPIFQF